MKITYHHERIGPKGGTTVAMEEIPVDMFRELETGTVLEAQVGLAKCSLKDNYNKKIGRAIAKSRLTNVEFIVIATSIWESEHGVQNKEVILKHENNYFLLQHTSGNKTVHLKGMEQQ